MARDLRGSLCAGRRARESKGKTTVISTDHAISIGSCYVHFARSRVPVSPFQFPSKHSCEDNSQAQLGGRCQCHFHPNQRDVYSYHGNFRVGRKEHWHRAYSRCCVIKGAGPSMGLNLPIEEGGSNQRQGGQVFAEEGSHQSSETELKNHTQNKQTTTRGPNNNQNHSKGFHSLRKTHHSVVILYPFDYLTT